MMISHVKTTPEKLSTVTLVDGQRITVIDSETGVNKEYIDFYDEEKDEIIRNLLTPGMECVTIETKQQWDSMSTAEKTDPTKVYFLPWK